MESSVSEPARQAIDELSSEKEPVSFTLLADLSNLNRSELRLFQERWDKLDDERRKQIINRLFELAEQNIEYNFDAIFKYCLKDLDPEIRCLAIEGLWEDEETSLINPLIDILENDESDKVQAAAAIALGKYAIMIEFESLNPQDSEKVTEALLGAVDDREKAIEVRRRVLESVSSITMPDVDEAIQDAYTSTDHEMTISALFAMGKSCNRNWLPVLIRELDNEDPEIRFEAAGALGELEEEEAVPYLINLVNDEDSEVVLAAIQALGNIGTDSAKECLAICLENENDSVREAAEAAIQGLDANDDPLSFRV